jgi:hypothetical protein
MWHLWGSVTYRYNNLYFCSCRAFSYHASMPKTYGPNNDVCVDVGKEIPTEILQSTYLNIFEYESGCGADNGCLLAVVLLQRLHWGVDVLQVGQP